MIIPQETALGESRAELLSTGTAKGAESRGGQVFPTHGLTRDFSSSRVIMTTVAVRCSHTIRQKSPMVSGRGPCVAM